jgi:putative ATPase
VSRNDLFNDNSAGSAAPDLQAPLADRMRPKTLEDLMGQEHLLGEGGVLRELIQRDRLHSMIFWGDPGVGKTTLARLIADSTGADFHSISAVTSGVGEVKKIIAQAKKNRKTGRKTILFIDEIHRFNKAQQDALLHAVEDGTLTLIGATTENPSFEVIPPLMSRCRVFHFERLAADHLKTVLDRALTEDPILKKLTIMLEEGAEEALIQLSGGDARELLNALEIAVDLVGMEQEEIAITPELLERAVLRRLSRYDKKGDRHYDTISAFIKSLRASDPDAAVYWLARMLDAGEDPVFIARRMVILASEDIGNAMPNALVLANAAFDTVTKIGMPEARITLAQAATYLASCPKSNASYHALIKAEGAVREDPERPVPLHLRNPVTGLMKAMDYGKDYQYAHNHPGHFVEMNCLPEGLEDKIFYDPSDQGQEQAIAERLKSWWKKRRK